ncbi:MAG: hypothetical protein V2I47_08325 [Bacteroidales bacterium]|jgi:hypothetical protein|nr:hypothetical protein [Bacteroidales bacterium]
MANGRPKKRKKVRYSEIRIRLSYKQKRSLLNYCHARKTTPNKLIKKMIRKYISNFAEDVPDEYYVTENQLELFNDAELVEDDVDFMEEEIENNEQGTGNMEEKEETSNTEYRISNIESQDESPEKPPTLF